MKKLRETFKKRILRHIQENTTFVVTALRPLSLPYPISHLHRPDIDPNSIMLGSKSVQSNQHSSNSKFLSLPYEILYKIVSQFELVPTSDTRQRQRAKQNLEILLRLSQTCKPLHAISSELLFKNISIKNTSRWSQFTSLIESDEHVILRNYIKNIKICRFSQPNYSECLLDLDWTLLLLRSLTLDRLGGLDGYEYTKHQ